jgi:hypothetical protein
MFRDAPPFALRAATEESSKDDERPFSLMIKAQDRMISADLTAHGIAIRN